MNRKKTSNQDRPPKISFRERFQRNEQKSLSRRKKTEQKRFYYDRKTFVIIFAFFIIGIIAFIIKREFVPACLLSVILLAAAVFYRKYYTSSFPKEKTKHGKDIAWWTVRTKPGHTFKYSLLPDRNEINNYIVSKVILCVLLPIFGVISLTGLAGMAVLLLQGQINVVKLLSSLFAFCFGGFAIWAIIRVPAYVWNYNGDSLALQYRKPKTTVEVSDHPLQIEKEYQFWVEQQGNYQQCHLQIYLVMIKTESYNVSGGKHSAHSQDFREECGNYLVEVMEGDKDITPDDPLRHTFSVFLSRDDYVPSVWHSFTHSGMDRYDWFLRVILVSKGEYLIQRNFPLVIVES